ncbi:uncharacterized protein [Littorina saxatilis]|uniref:Uncharacterized protein n=1 Tax=Littorina saxatilis TaxID=31220 RepID=A0AAN9BG93_9CAEN
MATDIDDQTQVAAESGQVSSLCPEDEQVVVKLYQTCPLLWPVFGHIIAFCDAADEDSGNYETLNHSLFQVVGLYTRSVADIVYLGQFAAAAGFAEQAVKVLRPNVGELGVSLVSIPQRRDSKMLCFGMLLSLFHNFTHYSNEFRPRLAKTTVFNDFVECLRTLKHLPPEILAESEFCDSMLGILHNCCKNPDVVPIAKHLDMVPLIADFLHKKPCTSIQVTALLLLAFIVDEGQLCLMEMDHDVLQHCLSGGQTALTSPNPKSGLHVEELVVGWSLLARLEFNRRLMVAKEGAVDPLKTVLQTGTEPEKEAAAATFLQLAMDAANAQIFQRNRGLVEALSALQHTENHKIRQAVLDTLHTIGQAGSEEVVVEENTALYDVLANQMNTLSILGMGKVEFLLSQLTDITSGGSSASDDVTCVQIVKALREMTREDSCQREILARGGLGLIENVLHSDSDDRKLESLKLLLKLASCKEHCVVIQGQTELMRIVQSLTLQNNEELRHTATHVIETVGHHVT